MIDDMRVGMRIKCSVLAGSDWATVFSTGPVLSFVAAATLGEDAAAIFRQTWDSPQRNMPPATDCACTTSQRR